MRKKRYSLTISLLSIVFLALSCVSEEKNTITVKGNSEAAINTEYLITDIFTVPSVSADCNPSLSANDLWIKFSSGASMWIRCYTPEESLLLPVGSFKISTDCGEGFIASFFQTPGQPNAGLCFSNGKLDILKEEKIYKVNVSLSISPECGSGTIKGRYTGKLLLRI